ncbi:MAG: DUF3833 domain-containing protein [Gammaproteobacteria bacterium]
MNRFLILAVIAALCAGCASPRLEDYADAEPAFDLAGYFDGRSRAWGQFQDRFGKVRRRFVVDIEGSFDGSTLTLVEDFVYDDGETEQRIWTIDKTGPDTWRGSADGVVGVATGRVAGNAFNWRYTFDLKTGENETLRVDFDDWLWQQDAGVVINRAYVSKLGVALGEVLIFFQKPAPGAPLAAAAQP